MAEWEVRRDMMRWAIVFAIFIGLFIALPWSWPSLACGLVAAFAAGPLTWNCLELFLSGYF